MSTYHTFKDPESIERSSSRHGRDVEEANDDIFETMFGISVRQLDVEERMKFVRKIYIIIAAQLATMVLFTYISMYIEVISDWIQWSKWVWWIPLLPITICALGCSYMLWSQHRELSWRARYSLLTVFTVLEGIVVCDLLAKFNFRFGLLVIILTLATSLGMIGFTYQTKYDFTDFPPLISAYTLTTLLVSPFALLFPTLDVNPVIGAGFLSALVSTYIIVEIYYLMRKLTQNDFIFAIAYLYVDLGYPVRCLHHICEVTERIPFANLAEED